MGDDAQLQVAERSEARVPSTAFSRQTAGSSLCEKTSHDVGPEVLVSLSRMAEEQQPAVRGCLMAPIANVVRPAAARRALQANEATGCVPIRKSSPEAEPEVLVSRSHMAMGQQLAVRASRHDGCASGSMSGVQAGSR